MLNGNENSDMGYFFGRANVYAILVTASSNYAATYEFKTDVFSHG
jgi:hypothetical protein